MRSSANRTNSSLAGLRDAARELWARVIQPAHPVTGECADRRNLLWPQMLQELGLDRRQLDIYHPGVEADLASTCARCRVTRRCRSELKAGTAAENFQLFCPSAKSLEATRGYVAPLGDAVARSYATRSVG